MANQASYARLSHRGILRAEAAREGQGPQMSPPHLTSYGSNHCDPELNYFRFP